MTINKSHQSSVLCWNITHDELQQFLTQSLYNFKNSVFILFCSHGVTLQITPEFVNKII